MRPRFVRAGAAVVLGTALSACQPASGSRDLNDTTAPDLTITVTASATAPGGLQTVAAGSTVTLTGAGGSVLVKATDHGGVSFVELWMSTGKNCNGVQEGPGLAGAPTKRVDGTVTAKDAPLELTAGVDINLMNLTHGCTYTFDVSGKAANAAATPVSAQSGSARLVYAP